MKDKDVYLLLILAFQNRPIRSRQFIVSDNCCAFFLTNGALTCVGHFSILVRNQGKTLRINDTVFYHLLLQLQSPPHILSTLF